MNRKHLEPNDTLALLHAKNEIIALRNQINGIDSAETDQEYFMKFQREVDMFEKKLNFNVRGINPKINKQSKIFEFKGRIAYFVESAGQPDNIEKKGDFL